MAALDALEALMPLEDEPDSGVREHLTATLRGTRNGGYLSVENADGAKETVTTWGLHAPFADVVHAWGRCRREGAGLDHPWDVACRGPRRIAANDVMPMLIDRGVYAAIDALAALGATTFVSCEGHPRQAYLGFVGRIGETGDVFASLGWSVRGIDGAVYAYMEANPFDRPPPGTKVAGPVADVADRDRRWRSLIDALETRRRAEGGAGDATGITSLK